MSHSHSSNVGTLAAASIGFGILILCIKLFAWQLTGSVALFSDALESLVNIGASIAAFFAIRWSLQPEDSSHLYGHHKAEYLSAVLEGALIALAAILILREAALNIMDPDPLNDPWLGIGVSLFAALLNMGWARYLISNGRRHSSPALVADGRHIMADVVTSAGVAVGLVAAVLTGWRILDPLLAGLVALNVLYSGWALMAESVGGLMDAAPPEEDLAKIRKAIAGESEPVIQAHDLRTRHAGRRTFVEFHLVVPDEMTVLRSHEICDRIEAAIREEMGECMITIHVEPAHKAKKENLVEA